MDRGADGQVRQIGPDEITLFDAVMRTAGQMSPQMGQDIGRILLVLPACEADGQLDMERVATTATRMGDGGFQSSG